MKYLLHIDTSTDTGAIALSGDGALLASRANRETRNHASKINNMINEVANDAGISLSEVDAIVVCAGPGSYTGLRIGLATAKGLCYVLDKPLLLDNRLTLLAHQEYIKCRPANTKYLSLLLAREKEYFISIYDRNFICILQPCHINEEALKKILTEDEKIRVITNVPEKAIKGLDTTRLEINNDADIDIRSWLLWAFDQYKCNNCVNLSTAEPFYLKQVYTHN